MVVYVFISHHISERGELNQDTVQAHLVLSNMVPTLSGLGAHVAQLHEKTTVDKAVDGSFPLWFNWIIFNCYSFACGSQRSPLTHGPNGFQVLRGKILREMKTSLMQYSIDISQITGTVDMKTFSKARGAVPILWSITTNKKCSDKESRE